jgi:uncharacterized protein (TIGR02466 family)
MELKADLWFPSIVWATLDLDADTVWLKQYADQLRSANPDGVKISNAGGWQSPSIEFPEFAEPVTPPQLKKLKMQLDLAVGQASQQAGLPKLELCNMWFNINGYKDHNLMHDHQGSLISGVLYTSVDEPELMGNIDFHREDSAVHFIPPLDRYNHFTSTKGSYAPKKGLLLLFPSWVKHSVNSSMSHKERYSISFNYGPGAPNKIWKE